MGNFLTVTGKEWSKNKTCTRPFGWVVMFTWFLCCPDNFIYVLHCITLMYKQFIFVCFAHLYNKIWIKMLFSTLCKKNSVSCIFQFYFYMFMFMAHFLFIAQICCVQVYAATPLCIQFYITDFMPFPCMKLEWM